MSTSNKCGCFIRLIKCLQCTVQLIKKNRQKLEYSQYTIALARQLTLKQVATTSIWPYTLEKYEMSRLYGKSKVEQYCALAESSNWSNYLNRNWLLLKRIQYAKRYLIFLPQCNANHDSKASPAIFTTCGYKRALCLGWVSAVDTIQPWIWIKSSL